MIFIHCHYYIHHERMKADWKKILFRQEFTNTIFECVWLIPVKLRGPCDSYSLLPTARQQHPASPMEIPFALPKLQLKYTPRITGILPGFIHAVWQLSR